MNKSESVVKLSGALAKAQAEMPAVEKNATNPFLKNRYADLGAVIEAAKPILARHGLSVVQMPVTFENTVGVKAGNGLREQSFCLLVRKKGSLSLR